ncbi:MAG: OFA family MFS transporter [Phycisphaerae bacterium]|nr:OFA family MFS transporter [Phycisphaerae bacterium]
MGKARGAAAVGSGAGILQVTFAAVVMQLCLGTVYGWSVFVNPLMEQHHWGRPQVVLAFSLAIAGIGIGAFLVSARADRHPRQVATLGGLMFGIGTVLAGLAVQAGNLVLLYIGYGLLGGVGIGLAYLTPIAVAIKWAPHRRGLVSGLVVMGFGAGAFIIGKIAPGLIDSIGSGMTLIGLGLAFTVVCTAMGLLMRNPPSYTPKEAKWSLIPREALGRGEFWILWGMLFLNVCAGIALISQAASMFQDLHEVTAAQAGLLVSAIAICNGLGRMFWSAVSEKTGRPAVFLFMFISQTGLFVLLPQISSAWLFAVVCCYIILCYGGGFGTMPAFTADLFGSDQVGRVYGPMLTAWSAAGVVGPMLYAGILETSAARGLAADYGYSISMCITAGLLLAACALPVLVMSRRTTAVGAAVS